MAFNVWFRIWPAQQKIITAIKNGDAPDASLVALAGQRSKHNTYLSVPLIWTMINEHTVVMSGKLFNIVTKAQFHLMLLEDIEYSADINYSDFDHGKLEHEVYNKPWGFYKSVLLSSHAQAKVITLFPDSEISLQEHMHREEHWVVIKGVGKVVCSNDLFDIKAGGYIKIPKRMKHKIINTSVKDNLVFSEVQLGEYFGEDDIIRFEDMYGRIKN